MTEQPWHADVRAVRRASDKAAAHYTQTAAITGEIFRRLETRLDYLAIEPKVVLDLGCGTGSALPVLQKRYKKALLTGLDISLPMLRQAAPTRLFSRKQALVQADAQQLPFADESVGLIVSNLAFFLCPQTGRLFSEISRVLASGGALLFTTLGPDTLRTFLDVIEQADPVGARLRFADMHDLGDMMAAAGLAQPVLDIEYLTVTYSSVESMLGDLRAGGAVNVARGRRRGLMSGQKAAQIRRAIEQSGVRDFTFEIVQGHAWKSDRSGAPAGRSSVLPERYIPIRVDKPD
ncbi:MAG: methyltransferase domain-containing protein [Gammaproteobacteria bacterium]|nr:methyltransferase domain-containing protein [Gammaproteobacteria bacterium]